MSKGLKTIADELNTRIRFFKTDERPPRQGVSLDGYSIVEKGRFESSQPACAYGKDMRAAAKELANMLRSQRVIRVHPVGAERVEYEMPDEIDPRQYK